VQEIFEVNTSEKLYGVIAWIPMLANDNLDAANKREIIFSDSRVRQLWDQYRTFGSLLSQTLTLSIPIAWDVYLIYLPNHLWETEFPPAPKFWMHQQNEKMSLYLDPPHLKEYVKTVLEGIVQ
jgi:hypothetical protein